MPTEVYAKKVTSAVLARHARAWFWTGNMAWGAWFLNTFFPRTFQVRRRARASKTPEAYI